MTSPIQQTLSHVSESEQKILKKSRDDKYDVLAVMLLGEDGSTARRVRVASDGTLSSGEYAVQFASSGTVYYLGEATPGTLTSAASWRISKVDATTGVVISWADGDANFNNVWNNYSSLDYS